MKVSLLLKLLEDWVEVAPSLSGDIAVAVALFAELKGSDPFGRLFSGEEAGRGPVLLHLPILLVLLLLFDERWTQ